jgi:hypothetical protein
MEGLEVEPEGDFGGGEYSAKEAGRSRPAEVRRQFQEWG